MIPDGYQKEHSFVKKRFVHTIGEDESTEILSLVHFTYLKMAIVSFVLYEVA